MNRLTRISRLVMAPALFIGCALAWADASQPAAPATQLAVGQRISLDLKGVDILDVLKLLSQKSGLNFVAGRNVSGRVTIFVKDVDVWEAFGLIVEANDLAYERHGDIITVMMARDYELLYGEKFQERKADLVKRLRYAKVAQVATVLNQFKSTVGRVVSDEATNTIVISDAPAKLEQIRQLLTQLDRPVESRVYALNYADAEKLKDKVQELLSPIGTFTFDVRTNTVVISDLPEVLDKANRVIQAFDMPDGQVLIEAKIVNVNLTDDNSLGIDWQRILGGIDAETRSNLLTRGNVISGDIVGGNVTGTAIRILTAKNNKLVIEALRKLGKTETLSNPRIMVSNNQEAKILVGTKEAFITTTTTIPTSGSTVTAPEIKTEEVGTKLFVTPNIKRDGHVQLKIRPEVSSVARTITNVPNTIVPIVQTTQAETNVLVKSGATLIIGGLIDSKNTDTENRIPGIGDIPFFGTPFRGKANQKSKSELVVFLTPQIIKSDGTPMVFPEQPAEGTSPAASVSPGDSGSGVPEMVLKDPIPFSYQQSVRQRLRAYLVSQFREASLKNGSVVVSFVLSHDGRIIGDADITSPEGSSFIEAASQALSKAQPFPSFPDGSQASEVRFKLAVEYAP